MNKFKILKGKVSQLETEVTKYLNNGYHISGDIHWTGTSCGCGCGERTYFQAVVKYQYHKQNDTGVK